MGKVRRQSIISVVLLVGSVLLGYLNKVPIGTRALSSAEIGVMGVLLTTASLFGIFAQVGIGSIVYRYFPFFKDENGQRKGFLSFALFYPTAGLILALIVLYFLKDTVIGAYDLGEKDGGVSLALVKQYYYLAFPLTLILVYFDVFAAYSSSLFKSAAPIFFRDVFTKLLLTILLIACLFGYIDFSGFMHLLVGAYLTQLVGIAVYLFFQGQLHIGMSWDSSIKEKRGEILQYGAYTMFSRGTNYLVAWIDSFMVSLLLGMSSAGVYYIFQYFGLLTTLAARALAPVTMPLVANGFKDEDMSKVADVYERTAIIQLIGGALILLGLFINLDNVVQIVPPEYSKGAYVGIIIGMAKIFDISTGVNGMIITNSKYYRLDFYFMILLTGVTILTNYYFIGYWGLIGAALATALTAFLYNFGKWFFVKWKFNMQPFTFQTIKVLLIVAITTLVGYYLPKVDNWYIDVIYRSGIATAIYATLILGTKVSPDINNALNMVLNKVGIKQ